MNDTQKKLVSLTNAAIEHFKCLLQEEDTPGVNLRLSVHNPGTPLAAVDLSYCFPDDENKADVVLEHEDFKLYIAQDSQEALLDANIDYEETDKDGRLSIKAPHIKGHPPATDSPILERLQYVFDKEVNPALASHGGSVELVGIVEESIIEVRFSGGCQGCGMVSVTLTQGIESTIKERFPEITEIRDVTEHSVGENPYY